MSAPSVKSTTSTPPPAPPTKPTPPKPFVKKTETSLANDSAAATAKEDTLKAIEKLENRLKAVNSNNVARVANSHVTSADESLTPMVSVKTGKPLDKFPETSRDIQKLTLVQLNDMLSHLEAEKTGSEAMRRERLRTQIGLKSSPA